VPLPFETNISAAKESQTMSTIIFEISAKVVPENIRNDKAMVNIMEVLMFRFP